MQTFSLIVFALMARYLTPAEFGLASVSFILVYACKSIGFDSVAAAIARKVDGSDLEYSTAFWMTLGLAGMACVCMAAFAPWADGLFEAPGLGHILRVMSLMLFVLGLARTQEVWMMRHFYFRTLAVRSIVAALVGGALGVASAMRGYGVWALVIQQIVTSTGSFILLWSTCPWKPKFEFSTKTGREIIVFSALSSGSTLAYAVNQTCDTILIGVTFGPASVGIYSVAKRLRQALHMIAATPVNGVAMPALAEVQSDPTQFRQVLLTALSVVCALCGPAFLGAAAVSPDAIRLLFGPQWVSAAPIFSWLAVGALLTILSDYCGTVFVIKGRIRWVLYLSLSNLLTTGAAFALFRTDLPAFMAAPFVIPCALGLPISIWLLTKLRIVSLSACARAALLPLAVAIVMALLVYWISPSLSSIRSEIRLPILIAFGVVAYAGGMAIVCRRMLLSGIVIARNHAG